MINPTEQDERQYLGTILSKLKGALKKLDQNLERQSEEIKENKEYLHEHKDDMDHAEKVSVRQSIDQSAMLGENAVAKQKRLNKLRQSPYFGRIDFTEADTGQTHPVYVGIYTFYDDDQQENIIYDWRAPISSMYYDFELGEAWYESPKGQKSGNIEVKRQYRIDQGEMAFMLENAVSIHDDILQEELSRAADDKMKNIVATIQRDQNAIIRNESSRALIIQGVAGSGKTSIALHRLAFLLYRFQENLSARDILIVSPNKVFADYISNVLPELGEDKVPEKGMEELAEDLLEGKYRFQSFFEQVDKLLAQKDQAFRERIEFKATNDFLKKLDEYLIHIENEYFQPTDLYVNKYWVPDWFIREQYDRYDRFPLFKRFAEITKAVEENVRFYYKYQISGAERQDLRKRIWKMFRINNLRALYKDFFEWLGQPSYFKLASRSRLEYADVFPIIYLKIRLEGYQSYKQVKHLLVDEMQDHTPVQYAVLRKLFNCPKTILGDANQTVNPYSSSSAAEIQKVFPEADCMKLAKSYRSTYEITQFAQQISPNEEVIPIERHGEVPGMIKVSDEEAEVVKLLDLIETHYRPSAYQSLGIVCKTPDQAAKLKAQLETAGLTDAQLLNEDTASFSGGIVITAVHMAKGLEFDMVIVPGVSAKHYQTELDRSLLYVACTRAMHHLSLTYVKTPSEFLTPQMEQPADATVQEQA